MKKTFLMICIALLLALTCVFMAACDETVEPDVNNGHNNYESATYTVTFNVDSNDFKLENDTIKDVPAGTKIKAPCDSNGNVITPIKTGYKFKYWSADGTSEFNFETDTINATTTLTAIYESKTYTHTLDDSKSNVKQGSFYIDRKLTITQNEDGTFDYQLDLNENIDASMPANKTLDLTYASTANLPCPTASNDKFLFWFYMKDGKPVQLTKVWSEGNETVATLEKYQTAGQLAIFAMFESTLPKVEVEFVGADKTLYVPSNGYIHESENPSAKMTNPGYIFKNWVYVVEDEDGDKEDIVFTFKNDDTLGTSVYSACSLSNYFTPSKLTLEPRWTKQISIATLTDYENLYDLMHSENPTDDEKAQIDEALSANIVFDSFVDLGGKSFGPLFGNYTFSGTIDGGEDGAMISNVNLFGTDHISLFGYVSGTVKNINLDADIVVEKDGEKYANKVLIGGIATQNDGFVDNCNVEIRVDAPQDALLQVVLGGICAVNNGDSSQNNSGRISGCSAKIILNEFKSESLVLGGIAARSNASSTLTQCNATINAQGVVCKNDGKSANGIAFVKIGGITASNGGKVIKCSVDTLSITGLESDGDFNLGGACAENFGAITETCATVDVKGNLSSGVCMGGIVGNNDGYVYNAHCFVLIDATCDKANAIVQVGGIVGNNTSAKTDSSTSQTTAVGAINCAYSIGNIALTCENATVYVGGIAARNSASKIASCFTTVDIVVKNTGNENNLGYLFGTSAANISETAVHYTRQNILKLGDETFVQPANSAQDSKSVFEGGWSTYNTLKIDLSDDIWFVETGSLPQLKNLM